MMRTFLLPAATLNALCAAAFAHPGHGSTEPTSVSHFLLEPVHAVPLAVITLAAVCGTLLLRRRRTHSGDQLVTQAVTRR
jgi:hypothetical protein